MVLKLKVSGRIARPVAEVFEAVADPVKLSQFFATGQGTKGRLETGATVTWDFHDFPGAFPVKIDEVVPNEKIVLRWGSQDDADEGATFVAHDNVVTILFEGLEDGRTLVTITEEGWAETPKGIRSTINNTEGWTGMLAALKVWVEHGINIRKDFYR